MKLIEPKSLEEIDAKEESPQQKPENESNPIYGNWLELKVQ